jgi:hypothetical protein
MTLTEQLVLLRRQEQDGYPARRFVADSDTPANRPRARFGLSNYVRLKVQTKQRAGQAESGYNWKLHKPSLLTALLLCRAAHFHAGVALKLTDCGGGILQSAHKQTQSAAFVHCASSFLNGYAYRMQEREYLAQTANLSHNAAAL